MKAEIRNGTIDIFSIKSHRNGICGAYFHVVRFSFQDDDRRLRPRMLAVVFDEPGHTAVLDQDEPLECWRGDHFEEGVRGVVRDFNQRTEYVPFEEWARGR